MPIRSIAPDAAQAAAGTERIVRTELRRWVREFSDHDPLAVSRVLHRLTVELTVSALSSGPGDPTRLELSLFPQERLTWIRDLRVAPAFRRRGCGRRLVRVAERIARNTGARQVLVFPLAESQAFWQRFDYLPHRSMTRVLVKSAL